MIIGDRRIVIDTGLTRADAWLILPFEAPMRATIRLGLIHRMRAAQRQASQDFAEFYRRVFAADLLANRPDFRRGSRALALRRIGAIQEYDSTRIRIWHVIYYVMVCSRVDVVEYWGTCFVIRPTICSHFKRPVVLCRMNAAGSGALNTAIFIL